MNARVNKYEATVYHSSTCSSHTKLRPFTQAQADEVGAVLETDGINIVAAQRLCEKWTKRGSRGDIRYSYRVPFCKAPNAEVNGGRLADRPSEAV
jgi:hypothetical protein